MALPLFLFNVFRFGFAAAFIGLHAALMAGFIRERTKDITARAGAAMHGSGMPQVSVIVPFRNESQRMEGLLMSLGTQDYPAAEYIFIDDRSDDEGPEMHAGFTAGRKNCHVITLDENPGQNPKQYAISRGIEAAAGDLFLFTDADCEVPPGWISAMAARMADKSTGALIGPVFKKDEQKGFFYFYQCIDHAIRYMYLAASTGIGAAGGGFGNNLILRRECLDFIGGYGSVPASPTEDAALVARIRSFSKFQVRSAVGQDTHVFTRPERTWASFVNQTLRWNNGGLFSPDPMTRLGFTCLMVSISMGIIAIPLLPLFPGLWPLPTAVVFSMIMNTLAVLSLGRASLPRGVFRYILQLFFTPAWMTMLTILGFLGIKTDWKGNSISGRA
jgi:cellulose synthase/poly-beta-1,6-N-acetylglucosamine synthase-like glycosyltransferase